MMFSKSQASLLALCLLATTEGAFARMRWMERDDKPVFLHPRRFGQEHPAVIDKLSSACPGQVCGNLAGAAITPLLAAQPECSQQDMADQIIDAAQQFDDATKANMIALAVEYRQAEKNTPPDFSTNPPTNRNSVFCQKAPKNPELNGLVQAQDPANDPNIFFDPATGKSVKKGDQPNTFPFGTSGSASSGSSNSTAAASSAAVSSTAAAATSSTANLAVATGTDDAADPCESVVTVTVTAAATATDATSTAVLAATSTSAAAATSTAAAGDIGDFGSCSIPQIEFGVGFDGRKETSFQPVDKTSYNHGSAQNIDIITQFICDTLTNSCGADATAKATCASAKAAADTVTAKTGGQADAFNAVFGITTSFADVAEVDDQGNFVPGTGSANSTTTGSGGIGDFGSCSVPQIEFGVGFDGRKETSFQPVDKTSYNHGSAQNIDIITQFICDTLTNSCGADATAKATCASAKAAADTVTAKTGGQADAFNAVFGITTTFANVAEVDDQGNIVAGTGSANSTTTTGSSDNAASGSTASGGIGDFGSCSVPQIEFGVGFDNRKETSFQPVDKTSYNHGSAQNIDIITQFICDTLTNSCGADATAKATCATAKAAADTKTAKTGAQADAFNAVFGIVTQFSSVEAVDDQGNVIPGSATGSSSGSAAASSAAATTAAAASSSAAAATSTAAAATTSAAAATTTSAAAAATSSAAAATSSGNLQTFTGALGGVTAPPVTQNADGSFQVQGNSSFKDLANALTRSCDVQHNQCANAANASGNKGDLTVAACGDQQTQCDAAH
ncbi:hypothetical protein PYCCODRAFT_1464397 [Trametes coccinea BRFM310]|uniref:Uncharacterized protein n=1 Tax=Trametes coccinea (strain BRFM310) TaxID=1353009 RepID=A0A1Y2IZ81_TRAC3|nr:hypothetical protein PYCCODRAFT_1464397 [Trametes coccinea BRFM310]